MHRHPGDLIRMLLAATLLVLSVLAVQRGHLAVVERDVFRLVNDLPDVLIVLFWPVMQLGTRFAPYVLGTVAVLASSRFVEGWPPRWRRPAPARGDALPGRRW